MTTSKAPTSGTVGAAGAAGPEQNLHLDHDSARAALGSNDPASPLEQAREAVTGTVAAAGERVAQVREAVSETVGDVRQRARGFYGDARDGAQDFYDRGTERLNDLRDRGYDVATTGRDGVERFVSENPLLVGVVGLAAGLLIGALLPRTRQEDQAIGRWADDARDQGVRYAREVTQRGRQFVDATVADIGSQVRETRDDLREGAQTRAAPAGGERAGPSGRHQNR